MSFWQPVLVSLISYFLGSISFARIVSKIVAPDVDITDAEIKLKDSDETMKMTSMGANTASMKLGARVGCTIGILDILKVFLPTLAFRLLFPDEYYFLIAAIGGFVGHCWPIYHRFKGGRGISALYGGLFAFDPIGAFVIAGGGMVVGLLIMRDPLITYAGGILLLIPWMWFTTQDFAFLSYAIIITILYILAMLPELREYIRLRDKYDASDMSYYMEQIPMGKSTMKIMDRLGLRKR